MLKKPNHGLVGKPGNALKAQDEKAASYLMIRCKTSDKAMWVKAAQQKKLKLTEWVILILNDAVKKE